MKKLLLTTLVAASTFAGLQAQNFDKVKNLVKSSKFEEAKTEIDKMAENEKFSKVAETWYNKAKVYAAIADNPDASGKFPNARVEAFDALKKYIAMDKQQQISLQLDQFQPLMSIYQGFFKDGAGNYNNKAYKEAFNNFVNAGEVSTLMTKKGWSNIPMDTTVLLYTAAAAQNGKMEKEAAYYYGILANAKVNGEGMEDCYKWLSDYYGRTEQNIDSATKFLNLGRELFPKDPWWTSYELDMIRETGNKDALFKKYEEAIAAQPDSVVFYYNYALELYEHAYNADPAQRPANSAELIDKVEKNLEKVISLQPTNSQALLVLGQVKYNKGVDLQNIAAANKGTKPEDIKKRGELKAEAVKFYDQAIPYLEKVVEILEPQGKLKMDDRNALKNALDILIIAYDQKGQKDKIKPLEEKYNNVDKKH